MDRTKLKDCRRVVVKVGTSTVTHPTGMLNLMRLERLVRELADLHNQGRDVVLISSGSVGAGVGRLGLMERPTTLPMKQAVAAVGQASLMQMYEKFFGEYGLTVGQVLVTRDGFSDRYRYLNIRNTLCGLLRLGVIPIINENDTVAVEEIKFGDNDTLSALVAVAIQADVLVILSDIDGLYDKNPAEFPDAVRLSTVERISDEIRRNSTGRGSTFASGGMFTKLAAGDIVIPAGIPMLIGNGAEADVVRRILDGEEVGTLFLPAKNGRHARKQWIAAGTQPQGVIVVDNGAVKALLKGGGSLLPSGITAVRGDFPRGQIVSIQDSHGTEVARGFVNYNSSEVKKIMGRHSHEIEPILGERDFDEVVHRDNLAVL
ncbi:MAG: glutamate 5-kinase [Dethiosulfovibrio peptidovorans]|nr:MAG: glutamate 5-kinase [Dethiosulfovibrio peptidovorans]